MLQKRQARENGVARRNQSASDFETKQVDQMRGHKYGRAGLYGHVGIAEPVSEVLGAHQRLLSRLFVPGRDKFLQQVEDLAEDRLVVLRAEISAAALQDSHNF